MRTDEKEKINITQWCVGSGATLHLCCEKRMFSSLAEYMVEISFEADKYIMARGKGDIEMIVDGENIKLRNVLYFPELHMNFISDGCIVETSYTVIFNLPRPW